MPDVRQSRLVKKPVIAIAEGGFGLTHRGGPPLQSAGEVLDPTMCAQPFPTDGSATPFCTIVEWHKRERAALVAAGQADAMSAGSTLPLVAVSRPPNDDRAIDFDDLSRRAPISSSATSPSAPSATSTPPRRR